MQKLQIIIAKLKDFSDHNGQRDLIEIDLMLDYTKLIYADLLEMRSAAIQDKTQRATSSFQTQVGYSVEESIAEEEEEEDLIEDALWDANEESNVETKNNLSPIVKEPNASRTGEKQDIRNSIGINDKYQLISELFGNDKNAYEEKITELNNLKTHQEATDWLNNNIFLKNWEEHSESVQLLFYIINKFFSAT